METAEGREDGGGEGDENKKAQQKRAFSHSVTLDSLDRDKESSNDGADDAASSDEEGQDRVGSEQGFVAGGLVGSEGQAGDDGADVRLEEIGTHTRNITDIVANVVGNDGGVARIVLVHIVGYLATEIGTDVGRLGEDAATDTGEQRDG